jgi:hypothetical protein
MHPYFIFTYIHTNKAKKEPRTLYTHMNTKTYACIHTYIHTYILECQNMADESATLVTYIYACIHAYVHIYNTFIHTGRDLRKCDYWHIHIRVHTYVHTYIHTFRSWPTKVRLLAHTYTRAYIRTYMHLGRDRRKCDYWYIHIRVHTYVHTYI